MEPKQVIKLLETRYTAKVYDKTKKISEEQLKTLISGLRLAPSSMGLQPWHFFVISSDEMKEKLAKTALGDNQNKVRDCSHLFVIAAANELTKEHMEKYAHEVDVLRHSSIANYIVEQAKKYSRFSKCAWLVGMDGVKAFCAHQCYVALGYLSYTAALLGLDSTIMGGFNFYTIDRILGLKKKGYHSVITMAVGFHAENDPEALRIKVRFDEKDVVTHL